VTGGAPSTSFDVDFCQFPGSDYVVKGQNPCLGLNKSLTTDANGNGQLTFRFPNSGDWSGTFVFAPGGDTNSPSRITTDNLGTSGTLSSPLVAISKMNNGRPPGVVAPSAPQEPGSGSVSLSGGNLTVTLKSSTASASFYVVECFSDGSSACTQIGTFTTDASGNTTATLPTESSSGSCFEVYRSITPLTFGFVSGFSVP
jgi:hypothetical protein